MAEFIGEKNKNVNIGEPVVFENKTDSAFEVSAGVIFHKSGIYEVSVLKSKTIVSKVTERKKGKWVWNEDGVDWGLGAWCCSECGRKPETWWESNKKNNPLRFAGSRFCGNCGADMKGKTE